MKRLNYNKYVVLFTVFIGVVLYLIVSVSIKLKERDNITLNYI